MQLRSALEELYDALGKADLPRAKKIGAQTATGNALEGVHHDSVDAEAVTSNLEKVGETLKRANIAVEEGTSRWETVARLHPSSARLRAGRASSPAGSASTSPEVSRWMAQ